MFGSMMSDKASTAKLLASGNASVDTVLARLDLPDHVSNNCNVGANLRYFMQFTEKNLPRILTAVQKPATLASGSAAMPPSAAGARWFDNNSSNDASNAGALLAARNAAALLVKYCQCCEKKNNNNLYNNPSAIAGGVSSDSSAADAHLKSQVPSPLGKVVPVMIGVFGRRGDLPDSVALDVQRILLASIETDHEATLYNINITLRPDIVSGVVRHLSTSMTISETLVSLFGSALNAKAMMMEVTDPSAFVVKWVEHDFHLRLVNHLSSAMKNIDCAPYFFFFQEMLKRAFSPNVGPMVDQILSENCFGRLFDIAISAAEDVLKVRRKNNNNNNLNTIRSSSVSTANGQTPRDTPALSEASPAADELVDGETPPITSIGGIGRTISGISNNNNNADEEPEYPYLSEALNLVYQCVGIIRRSLPPPESEPIYMSRRLPLSHGPVHVMLRYLPRLVNILRSAVPSEFRPSSHIVRRHHNVVEKIRRRARSSISDTGAESDGTAHSAVGGSNKAPHRDGPLISPSLEENDKEDNDTVRVDDGGDESDAASTATTSTVNNNASGKKKHHRRSSSAAASGAQPTSATAVPPRTIFGPARLAITDIIVELTLFRSRVCDEALVASGAIEALLDCAEVFANHDLLLRNVHRVIMAVMQRPAYSEISLASNVTAAIAASEAAQKSMAQQQGGGGGGAGSGGAVGGGIGGGNSAMTMGGLSSNLSFASNTYENGRDSHPSFTGLDDLRRQYSSSSLSGDNEGDDDVLGEESYYGNTYLTTLDDELLFHGGKTIISRKNKSAEAEEAEKDCAAKNDSEADEGGASTATKKNASASGVGSNSGSPHNTSGSSHKRHPRLLRRGHREALEAEKLIERQILQRLDRETLAMVHIDPLVRFLTQKRPLSEMLYSWAATPEAMSPEEQAMMPEGQRAFRDFTNTSLQVHATQMLQRLREVGASQTLKNECGEALHCNDEISSKLALWQKPITGDRFTEKGSGCLERIVHREVVFHREPENSFFDEDEDDDEDEFGLSAGGSNAGKTGSSGANSTTFDFDADNLITGRSRASNNDSSARPPEFKISESPEKKRNGNGSSTDDFQNEDVTGEADRALVSPRKRSNSIGREHRYAAAYESDDDVGNTSGGLFTDDTSMLGFGLAAGILKDEPCNLENSPSSSPSSSSALHKDPFTNLSGASDDFASPVVTRPRSRHSSAPPEPNSPSSGAAADPATAAADGIEAFDESAFETRVLEDLSSGGGDGEKDTAASPPHYDRYLDGVPEYKPSGAYVDVTGFGDDDDDEDEDDTLRKQRGGRSSSNGATTASSTTHAAGAYSSSSHNTAAASTAAPSSKFKVTFASGRSGRAGSVSAPPHRSSTSPTSANGTDDSFELDEDAIGVIEKTRGVSVDSSVDSDTADMLFDGKEKAGDDHFLEEADTSAANNEEEEDVVNTAADDEEEEKDTTATSEPAAAAVEEDQSEAQCADSDAKDDADHHDDEEPTASDSADDAPQNESSADNNNDASSKAAVGSMYAAVDDEEEEVEEENEDGL